MDDGFATGFLAGMDGGGGGGNGGGMFGGSDGWLGIVLLALLFGWGGNRGGIGGGGDCATQADVRAAVDQQTLISKLDQQTYGLADSTYSLNNTITNGFHGVDRGLCDISHQISDCCCTTQGAIKDVRYDMATQLCGLNNTIQNTTRDINDTIRDGFARMEAQANARYVAELERKLNNCDRDSALQGLGTYLINQLRPAPIPSYSVPAPYCYGYNTNACGC